MVTPLTSANKNARNWLRHRGIEATEATKTRNDIIWIVLKLIGVLV